jgi:CubicO group peptidase (beta-lactamase class C family)
VRAPGSDIAPRSTTYFAGGYGLQSTARDYMLFETMLLNKGTIHGKRVLKPESVALMSSNLVGDLYKGVSPERPTRGTGFGVLVRVVTDAPASESFRSKGAFGWGGAYGTVSWTDPAEQLVAALMIQQPVGQLQSDFAKTVRGAITA